MPAVNVALWSTRSWLLSPATRVTRKRPEIGPPSFGGMVVFKTTRASNGAPCRTSAGRTTFSTATSGRLDVTVNGVNVESITAAADLSDQSKVITGNISGEAHLTGLPDSPTGTATVNLANGTVIGQAAQLATANVVFDGRTARLERGEVRLAQGQLVATGTYDLKSNNFQAQGTATNVDLDQLANSLNLTSTTVTGTANANFNLPAGQVPSKQPPGQDVLLLAIP